MDLFKGTRFELTRVPQGITVVIAAFLPILAITAMSTAVGPMIGHFASDPAAKSAVPNLIGAPGLAMAILCPFAGWFVDLFGRRKLLLVSTLIYGFFGTLPWFLNNLDQIYYSRLALGVAEAGILTVVNTLIGDYWDDRGRKNWLLLQGLLGPFVAIFVSVLVGSASEVRWNGVFLVYLVAFPVWVMMFMWLFEPKRADASASEAAPKTTAFPVASAALIAAVTFFAGMLYYVFIINGALAFAEIGVTKSSDYSALIALPQFCVLLGAGLFRLLANRSNYLQLGVMFLLIGLGLGGLGIGKTPGAMVAALVIQQTAAGMSVPALIAWTQPKFAFEHRGLGMGIWTSAFFLAQSQSPRLVHWISDLEGSMQGAFRIAGLAGLAGAAVALTLALAKSHLKERQDEAA